jgi:hypothetical protein
VSALSLRRAAWLAFALLCCASFGAMAAPRAWLDRDTVRLGETVTLNVETDARGGSEPDFSQLERSFRRLGTSSSTQLSYVNGRQSARTLWAVALEPLQEGVIGIPALVVGSERTEPLQLTVLPMPQGGSAAAGDDVFLEISALPAAPYVQQQVRYTVRLYYAVSLLEGQLEEPLVAGAPIRRLGQDVQYQTNLSNRRYHVVERRYALVPEASGTLEIPGPQFRGRALRSGGYGSLLNPNSMLAARGNAITLEVRPRPAAGGDPWLPAQSLQLLDESGALPAQVQVGEPLTLALRLSAQGLSAEQLPELQLPAIPGAQVYPDQEATQTRDDGEWLRGERVRKFAVVPERAGRLEIPAVTLRWWNVSTDSAETAQLAARTIEVVAAPGTQADVPAGEDAAPAEADGNDAEQSAPSGTTDRPWVIAAVIFAVLWLATLAMLLVRRRARALAPAAAPAAPRRAQWGGDWKAALHARDAAAAARALVDAGQQRDPACRSLDQVVAQLGDPSQQTAVRALERVLYRAEPDAAVWPRLREAFARGPRWRERVATAASDAELPPLYSDHR